MRLFLPLPVAVFLSACAPQGPVLSDKSPVRGASNKCSESIERLNSAEITAALVGTAIRFAGEEGVCKGAIWITSHWMLSLNSDGHYTIAGDRGGARGPYEITGDQLCLAGPEPCMGVYRDSFGRIYLDNQESLPAMIAIERFASPMQ